MILKNSNLYLYKNKNTKKKYQKLIHQNKILKIKVKDNAKFVNKRSFTSISYSTKKKQNKN